MKKRERVFISIFLAAVFIIAAGFIGLNFTIMQKNKEAVRFEITNGVLENDDIKVEVSIAKSWPDENESGEEIVGAQYDLLVNNCSKAVFHDWSIIIYLPEEGYVDSFWNGDCKQPNQQTIIFRAEAENTKIIKDGKKGSFGFVMLSDNLMEINTFEIEGYFKYNIINSKLYWVLIISAIICTVILIIYATIELHVLIYGKQQQRMLEEALEQAKRANESKSRFLFNMSHDIRTPMNAVLGFTELAKKNLDNPQKVSDYLDKVTVSGKHLLRLIDDILDMARIESGRINIEEEAISLKAKSLELYGIMKEEFAKKEIEFYLEIDIKDELVYCDTLHMRQVLLNLLSNSLKYTKPKGKVCYKVLQISDSLENYAVYEFHVKDTGIGMSREFINHIFEPFEREDRQFIKEIQGTGLGLSITKGIVEAMNGKLEVKSEIGKGSEFIITYKLRLQDSSAKPKEIIPDEKFDFEGKRILLAEDNKLNQEIAQEILKEAGFEVETASDGSAAIEMLQKSAKGYYDLILMDIQMPYMDGYKATETIRSLEDEDIKNIPIIAMTANAFEEDRKRALQSGMNAYITKPIDIKSLLKVLNNIFSDVS